MLKYVDIDMQVSSMVSSGAKKYVIDYEIKPKTSAWVKNLMVKLNELTFWSKMMICYKI